jgi:type I restriction enzyme S subunit
MIPKGWEKNPIKDVCDSIIDCVNKTAPVVDYKTPFKMLRTTNIRDGRVNTEDVRYVTEDTYKEWVRRGVPKVGDLIFTREAPVGEIGVLEDDNGIFLGQRTMMYRANLKKADNYFLFYSLQSRFCQKQIEDFSNGGTVAHMRVPDCGEIIVNVPPLPEQKKIAKILSTWDKAITTTKQLLANSQQQKKALMQQLLTGKKRLKGFNKHWIEKRISSFIRESRIQGSTGEQAKKITVKLYGLGVVSKDEKRMGSESTQYYKRSAGQFIYSKLDFLNGAFGIIPSELDGYESTLDLPAFDFLPKVNTIWFLYYISREDFYSFNLGLANGGRKARRVNPKDFLSLKIPTPSDEEQQAIAAVLSAADREIDVLQQKLEGLKQEKKAMMQQLLTGKRRVKV